ncbi:transglutaminase domain-containing protein [Marinifilum sp. D737]|uniref:transglutaminase domain-containing protein n=1 Tax=Marinifilum sp. D737 TaxID=2969628 RepID=UPI00227468AF|nr:transglutaminase domain-containing protein [Marinifilum sp. D737]MCY1636127.1 transglutaminase-like domain-containing protein [Marinifilum sp. D737]
MNKLAILVVIILFTWGCQSKYPGVPTTYNSLLETAFTNAGKNATELQKALSESPKEQREGMAFIISHMPQRDLSTIKADFLLENAEYAYKARKKYAWCAALADSVFFNEVLPYANISEERDPWRKEFYSRFAKYVEGKDDLVDAVMSIAKNIKDEVNVEYNTKRSRVDISPFQAMKENMATCTGLSILLTDAFRSVGIPSHLAGTAMWTNYKGNHTWCEVLIEDEWKFIEYYPEALNKSWFLADAGKSDPNNMLHWIYAASYKPTDMPYYAAPDGRIIEVVDLNKLPNKVRPQFEEMKASMANSDKKETLAWGVNVTQRYIDLYHESIKNSPLQDDELMANVVVFDNDNTSKSDSRISCRVDVQLSEKNINFGYSPRKTDDMNQFLQFKLKKESKYKFVVSHPESKINKEFTITTGNNTTQDIQLILK